MAYENTTVPVERSQGELRKLLGSHGAGRFEFGEAIDTEERRWAAIGFALSGRSVRIKVPFKLRDEVAIRRKLTRARSKTIEQLRYDEDEQEAKRIWRVLAWNLKARLEAVQEGVETFEEAFLAHLVDERTGQTIYEQLVQHGRIDLGETLPQLEAVTG